ncbi:uncharacterized protein LOC126757149 isoform X1 [Bactrocera neohumeralis]|uniref:uncharacterized protein LOC126757149 isoform X1 n=1 Tax=Bactrocera neohumeralis TaxID=98809 RepID=UPI0021659340|nr:uncharacterized protein LOC126757149 isoform X1 [Bactrocera neohumeralis]
MMDTPEIVVKTEMDFDFIANYTGEGDTQNSHNSQADACNTKAACFSAGVQHIGARLDTVHGEQAASGAANVGESDDVSLMKLLKQFDLEILYTTLKLNDITFRSLKYLTADDINTAIRHIGYRAEFREKLFAWCKEKFPTADKSSIAREVSPRHTAATINGTVKKPPTSIVVPAISMQPLQQLQTAASGLQTIPANMATNNAIATLTVIPSYTATTTTGTIAATISTTATTGSATIIKRNRAPAEDFLSLLPGVSSATARMGHNMPAVVLEPTLDLRGAFSFMPQNAKSPKRHAMATITAAAVGAVTTTTTASTAAAMTTRAAMIKTINAEEQFMTASGSGSGGTGGGDSNGNRGANAEIVIGVGGGGSCSGGDGYAPKGPLIMQCPKVDTGKVLQSSHIGQRIKQFYNKNGYLENSQRNEIVRLIVSDVMRQGESLSPKDLRAILSDIITLFPNEQAAADYYFIYRGGKGNPLGRLYQRYSNENVKRRRMIRLSDDEDCMFDVDMTQPMSTGSSLMDDDDTMSTYPHDLPGHVPRVDEMTALALKQLLTTDHFSWEEVCDKWIQTWALRQKELQQSGLAELLTNWSKLADPRAAELYKIDFRHVFPDKENLLVSKWDDYMKKVTPQFDKKLHHDDIKKLYKYCKMGMASKDEKDFIYAVGLTALLPCTSRFKDHYGKLSIRANLTDSIDAFVMRLNTLESYESRLDLYNRKYGPVNRTTHPFLVVIMPNECTISKIYVALENHFYCMQSFLQALDLCFKIYHTCNLKYPTMCENVWTFIQRYFYDMTVPWEARNANLVSLMVSLTMQN